MGLVPFVGVMQMWDKRYGLLRSPSTRLDTGVATCATLAQLLYGLTALRVAQAEGGEWKKDLSSFASTPISFFSRQSTMFSECVDKSKEDLN